jgi:ABC-type Fe3+-hydroxamate transport system substrate-binding protein
MKSQLTLGVLSRECSLSLRKIVAILLLPLCWVGCDNINVKPVHEDRVVTEDRSSMKSDSEYGTTIVDKMEREITIVGVPKRIVSLSPSTTELLFALGLGDSIVGVTEHCNYPEEAKAIAKVGSGTLEGISREAILNAKPDLILCKWDNHRPLVETFERVNIPIVGLGSTTNRQSREVRGASYFVDRIDASATGETKESSALHRTIATKESVL